MQKPIAGGSSERVIAVEINDEVKVYPINLLTQHELVNGEVGGRPIFASYCILADLGAVYDRRIGEHTYTYAVNGYTYSDPLEWGGRDAFILWDRDTESLWWPPIGKAVAGTCVDLPMKVLESKLWAQTTFGAVKSEVENVQVLKTGQTLMQPVPWPKYAGPPAGLKGTPNDPAAEGVPPYWG